MHSDYPIRLQRARHQLLDQGSVPQGVLPELIARSWSRCADTGLSLETEPNLQPMPVRDLKDAREKNQPLLTSAQPEMENLHAQIADTQSVVILTDAGGTILHAQGNPEFIDKAQRVALQPGATWSEDAIGTNAIGTALVEGAPVFVTGAEHYFRKNAFLNCSAAPIMNPRGAVIGVLDVSGDCRQPQEHATALVRMSAQMIENRLFHAEFARDVTVHFHARPEFMGTLWEGVAAFSPTGRLIALNKSGMRQLGIGSNDFSRLEFGQLFEGALERLLDVTHIATARVMPLVTRDGQNLYARIKPGIALKPVAAASDKPAVPSDLRQLNALNTGDAQIGKAVSNLRKIVGREIPILIEGETGTGKELFAKAIHAAGARGKEPFVAINCASIPEGLIEAELFGYEEGAFTGAKRRGAAGKIMQADGGTLFLDEIGEMPLPLQARLLRVLQEREIVPLGGSKSATVNIAVIAATNRKLRERVEQGGFREDLYYRLNGLRVTLPPLRQRTDLMTLVGRILDEESERPVLLAPATRQIFMRHAWRGNVRQLRNVLRAALAFMGEETVIQPQHLPEDFVEELERAWATSVETAMPVSGALSIKATEMDLIRQTLLAENGNITAAARSLGISRATLYRKIKRFKLI
ncbi:MAG: sigma-54-dependent Fis family transcriptional regulator [Methylobacillus sp.]|jgi:transcriptional regulator of acetoin/glycerol metabolism|nr:sigma-54-dependent Fis family transcriptional regulator [Methylobacillus sp.]